MIITKLKERPKITIDDDGNKVVEEKPRINRAKVVGVQANDTFTQVLINTPSYQVKDFNKGFTQNEGLPYILINYNDGRTSQFMFHHRCGLIDVTSALSEDNKEKQFAVFMYNWPEDLIEIKEFTVQDEVVEYPQPMPKEEVENLTEAE